MMEKTWIISLKPIKEGVNSDPTFPHISAVHTGTWVCLASVFGKGTGVSKPLWPSTVGWY